MCQKKIAPANTSLLLYKPLNFAHATDGKQLAVSKLLYSVEDGRFLYDVLVNLSVALSVEDTSTSPDAAHLMSDRHIIVITVNV